MVIDRDKQYASLIIKDFKKYISCINSYTYIKNIKMDDLEYYEFKILEDCDLKILSSVEKKGLLSSNEFSHKIKVYYKEEEIYSGKLSSKVEEVICYKSDYFSKKVLKEIPMNGFNYIEKDINKSYFFKDKKVKTKLFLDKEKDVNYLLDYGDKENCLCIIKFDKGYRIYLYDKKQKIIRNKRTYSFRINYINDKIEYTESADSDNNHLEYYKLLNHFIENYNEEKESINKVFKNQKYFLNNYDEFYYYCNTVLDLSIFLKNIEENNFYYFEKQLNKLQKNFVRMNEICEKEKDVQLNEILFKNLKNTKSLYYKVKNEFFSVKNKFYKDLMNSFNDKVEGMIDSSDSEVKILSDGLFKKVSNG